MPYPPKSFPLRSSSFKFALKGILIFINEERHALVHAIATMIAVSAGIYYHISNAEWIMIVIACAMVWTSEFFNSCIERIVDIISPQRNAKAGAIKDMAAGAVLIASIAAFIIALIIFIPKITI